MQAEIYRQLINLGFEGQEARPMSDDLARVFNGLGVAGWSKVLGWLAKAILLSLVESWAAAILF